MKEIWRTIPLFPYYAASSIGRVKSLKRKVRFISKAKRESWRLKEERILSSQFQNGGYEIVHLSIDGNRVSRTVHSLVAGAFLGPRPKRFDVCHLNGVRKDNRVDNLKYDTRSNNFQDSKAHGTYYLRCTSAKLSPKQVREIRKLKGTISSEKLARQYGVGKDVPGKIWRGTTWSHIR